MCPCLRTAYTRRVVDVWWFKVLKTTVLVKYVYYFIRLLKIIPPQWQFYTFYFLLIFIKYIWFLKIFLYDAISSVYNFFYGSVGSTLTIYKYSRFFDTNKMLFKLSQHTFLCFSLTQNYSDIFCDFKLKS